MPNNELYERIKKAGQRSTSSSSEKTSKSLYDRIKDVGTYNSIGFDTFQKDLKAVYDNYSAIDGWRDAETMAGQVSAAKSMLERANAYKMYYASKNPEYDSTDIDSVIESLTGINDWLTNQSSAFGAHTDADSYNAQAKKYADDYAFFGNMSSADISDYIDRWNAENEAKTASIDAEINRLKGFIGEYRTFLGDGTHTSDAFREEFGFGSQDYFPNGGLFDREGFSDRITEVENEIERRINELSESKLTQNDAALYYYYKKLYEELGAEGYTSDKYGAFEDFRIPNKWARNFDMAVSSDEETIKQTIEAQKMATGAHIDYEGTGYKEITDEEKSLYLYLRDNVSPQAALDYYNYLYTANSDYNMALAARVGKTRSEAKSDFEKILGSVGIGLESWAAGIERGVNSLFSDKPIPTQPFEYESSFNRESFDDSFWKGALYDVGVSFGNMAPSILATALTGNLLGAAGASAKVISVANLATSAATFGTSIYGNAYNEALLAGHGKEQAALYGIFTASAEVALQHLLGGIPGIGQHLTGEFIAQLANRTSSVLLKITAKLAGDAIGEFTEEYIQEILGQVFKNTFLGENGEIKLVSEEALYSGFLGALTSAGLNIPKSAFKYAGYKVTGKKYSGDIDTLIKAGLEAAPDTEAYKFAEILQGKIGEGKKITNAQKGYLEQSIFEAVREGKSTVSGIEGNSNKAIFNIEENAELTSRIQASNKKKYDVIRDYLFELLGGREFTMSDGRKAIMDKRDAQEMAHGANKERTTQLGNTEKLIEKATYSHSADNIEHKKFSGFHYYAVSVRYGDEVFDLWLNVGVGKNDKQNHLYAITNQNPDTEKGRSTTHYGVSRPVGDAIQNASSTNSIPQNSEKSTGNSQNSENEIISELWEAAGGARTAQETAESAETGKRTVKTENAAESESKGNGAVTEAVVEDEFADDKKKLTRAVKALGSGTQIAIAYNNENDGKGHREKQNVGVYINDYKVVRAVAANGHSAEAIRTMDIGGSLSSAQFDAAVREGHASVAKDGKLLEAERNISSGAQRRQGKVYFNGMQGTKHGKSSLYLPASGINEKWRRNNNLSKDQVAALEFIEGVLVPMGIDIVLYSSANNKALPNGMYDGKRIYIDIEAGMTKRARQTYVMYAIAHELTHMAERLSPETWRKYADAVLDILAKEDGKTVDELIRERQNEHEQAELERLKRVYYNAINKRTAELKAAGKSDSEIERAINEYLKPKIKQLDEAGAIKEIVADASQLILTRSSNFAEKLKAKDAGLCEKIIALAKKAVEKIRELLSGLAIPNDGVSSAVERHLDELTEYFDEMLADTLYKAGYTNDSELSEVGDKVQYSPRDLYVQELSDADIDRYYKTGKTGHVIHKKEALKETTGSAILKSDLEIENFINDSIKESKNITKGYAVVPKALSDKIATATNNQVLAENWFLELSSDDIYHLYQEHHKAKEPGDMDMETEEVVSLPKKIDGNADVLGVERYKTQTKIKLGVQSMGGHYIVVEMVSSNSRALRMKTAWKVSEEKYLKIKNEDNSSARNRTKNSPAISDKSSIFNNSIPQNSQKSTPESENLSENISDETVEGSFTQNQNRRTVGETDRAVQNQNREITEYSTEQERYEILKNKTLKLDARVKYERIQTVQQNIPLLRNIDSKMKISQRKKIIKELGEILDIYKSYENKDTGLSFYFSRENLKESLDKQTHSYKTYTKLLSCLDDVIKNAVCIEQHYREKHNPDPSLKKMYVFVSAFSDGDDVIPVKLEVKEFSDKNNALYVIITLGSIKKDEVIMEGDTENGVTQATRSSIISISQFLSKINPKDESFIKYIPDRFLDEEKLTIKKDTIEKNKKDDAERNAKKLAKVQNQNRRPIGEDDRAILARIAEGAVKTQQDFEILEEYRKNLDGYRKTQRELKACNAEIDRIIKGDRTEESRDELGELFVRKDKLMKLLDREDRKLLNIEAMSPIRRLIAQEREKTQKANQKLAHIRESYDRSLKKRQQEMRDKQLERERKRQERNMRATYLARAERALSRIYRRLANPTKNDHIPSELLPFVKTLFDTVDVSHHFAEIEKLEGQLAVQTARINELMAEGADSATIAAQEAYAADLMERIKKLEGTAHNMSWRERMEMLTKMIAKVEEVQSTSGIYADFAPGLAEKIQHSLDIFTDQPNITRLFDAEPEQLRTYAEALESISHSIIEAGKLYANKRASSIAVLGDAGIEQFGYAKKEEAKSKLLEKPRALYGIDSLNPAYFGRKLGSATESVINELFDGFYATIANVRIIDEFSDKLKKKYKVSNFTGENEKIHDIMLEGGGRVRLTTSQLMTVYALHDRSQAQKHLYGKGIKAFRGDINEAARKTTSLKDRAIDEGKRLFGKSELDLSESLQKLLGGLGVHEVTPGDVEAMIGKLDKNQKECVKEMKKFLKEVIAPMGNKTSQTLYLYDMFTEDNYFPIESDKTFIRLNEKDSKDGDISARSVFSILNKGFTKPVQENAGNPIIIRDIFDVFMEHCFDMANYGGLGVAVSDTIKWLNYKNEKGSLRGEMEEAYGKTAEKYIRNLLMSIEGELKGTDGAKLINKMIRNVKIAAVAANLRVALLQPTAYIRAGMVLRGKNLVAALRHKPMIKEAQEHSELMYYKMLGFYDMNTSSSLLEKLKDDQSTADKIREGSTWFAGKMDEVTWGCIWRACRYEVDDEIREKSLDIKKDSDEYFAKVRDKFHEVINFTQVIDTPMHKNKLMSDPDTGMKQLTAFMAEPMLTYDMLMSAVEDCAMKKPDAGKKLRRAFVVYSLSIAFQAALGGLADAARDDDDDERWLEKYGEAILRNMFGVDLDSPKFREVLAGDWNPLNNMPIIKEIFSLLEGYEPTRMDLQGMEKFIQSVNRFQKIFTGKGDFSYKDFYSICQAASQLLGIPISNIVRTVKSAYNTFLAWFGQN